MLIRPFLMLCRSRLITSAILSVLAALLLLFITSADGPKDIGVLWHHFCGCAPRKVDATLLRNLSTATCIVIGVVVGFGGTSMGGARNHQTTAVPGLLYGEMRFLLTRPARRSQVLLLPIAISVATIALFPAVALLVLLGWLSLVHAPALGHLLDIARLLPGGEGIGQQPGLMTVLSATHFVRYYAASVTVGLCAFAVYFVQRWWIHSQSGWLRFGSALTIAVPGLMPLLFMRAHGLEMRVFLLSGFGSQIAPYDVWLHLLFIAVMLASCWRIAQRIEV